MRRVLRRRTLEPMRGTVPLARRNLLAEPRRLAASAVGVGLAVMLILLLDGMWAGVRRQATVYSDRAGGDVYVLQTGVRDLTAGAGSLPLATLDAVRADPAVEWAAPVRTAYVVLELHGRKIATYVVGSVPGQRGGAWSIDSGRAPAADDEIVLGTVLADRHGVRVGDRIDLLGHRVRVVGLSDTSGYMFAYAFVTHAALDRLAGSPGTTGFVLAGSDDPAGLVGRLRASGLNALTAAQVGANDLELATGIFGPPVRLMVGIALAAGTLIIALTSYTAVVERRREYGIAKAMGATGARLVRLALAQTFALAALGLGAGWVLYLAGRALVVSAKPQFTVLLTAGGLARAVAAALVMALVAAVVPARRLSSLEPAAAYRSAS